MKKFIIIAFMLAALLSCDFEERLDDMEGRIAKLEELCSRMNEEISAIHGIITALQNKDYVTSVEPVMSEGKEIGYTITFSQSGSVTIYHGKDGHHPTVGAKADTDGIYYWTIDGEWLLDVKGNKLPVTGKDGITPQLKIENGYWYVSYDNGTNWIQLGRATGNDGKDGDSFFQNVTVTETEVIFTLADGTTFTLPRYRKVSISFDITDNEAGVFAGESITIKYTLANATDSTVVTASSDGQYIVKVKKTDKSSGKFIVKCPDPYVDGFINVMVSDNGYSFVKVINFYENKIEFPEGLEYNMNADGGTVAIPVSFNFDYTVKVSQDAASWLSIPAQTKAPKMRQDTIKITVAENTGRTSRTGKVFIYANAFPDKPCQEIIIKQEQPVSPAEKDMVFKVIASPTNWLTVYLPLWGEIDCTIDWGDGCVESYIGKDSVFFQSDHYEYLFIHHEYPQEDEYPQEASYEVRISGKVTQLLSYRKHPYIKGNYIPSHSVQEVVQWGATGLISLENAFYENTLLTKVAKPNSLSFKEVTSFENAFCGCKSLTSIPENLFSNCSNATDFRGTFDRCTSLTSIPENLFSNCSNATSFESAFYYCESLTSIPESLFANCPNVKDFGGVFSYCTSLTSIPANLFSNCPNVTSFEEAFCNCKSLTSIPANLFSNCPDVTSFESTFTLCSSLTTLPESLFSNCPDVTSFKRAFGRCTLLTSIPENLFSNCPNVTSFRYTFYECTSLTSVPVSIFDYNKKVKEFVLTFHNCHLMGESPYTVIDGVKYHLYERENNPDLFVKPNGMSCFYNCYGLLDYYQMPNIWTVYSSH